MTWQNKLFYGDNLRVLRDEIADETVDLVYLDPPFNSAANYNVLFREATGERSAAQITAFEDTWHWTHESEATYQELATDAPERLARLIEAMRQMLGTSDMMAYLVMMAPRLAELHRVLKPTGSIYLHCFTPETPVRMANGEYKPICGVGLDEAVVSESGVSGRVENCLSKRFSGELLNLYLTGVPLPLNCTPEHRIFVLKKEIVQRLRWHWAANGRFARGVTKWKTRRARVDDRHYAAQAQKVEARELQVGDYCLVPIDREVWEGEFLEVPLSSHPNAKSVPHQVRVDERLAELCGYYLAEGAATYGYTNWTLHENENHLAERIALLVWEVFGLETSCAKVSNKKAQRLTVCSVSLARFFDQHFGTGSGNKKLPLALQKSTPEVQCALFAAWAKGDGWIDRRHGQSNAAVRISTTSYNLAMQMQQIALRLGAIATVGIGNRPHYRPQDNASVCYRVQITEPYFELAGISMASEQSEQHSLRRCFILNDWLCVPVRAIERSYYDGEVFDLHIEPQHSYCASGIKVSNCDPTASHYLKLLMDSIFGVKNYRNEITWKRRTGSSSAVHQSNKFGVVTDTIFFYVKSDKASLHAQYSFDDPTYQQYVEKFFRYVDEDGRRYQIDNLANPAPRPNLMYEYKGFKPPANGWAISREKMEQWDRAGRLHFPKDPNGRIRRKRFLDELKGKPVQNLWDDIEPIGAQAQERLGYPTQKPEALLERIIKASSNEGDVVLDPFCGCGTAVIVAERLKRRWLGIDITHLAVSLIKNRLVDTFGTELSDFVVSGTPHDAASAEALALQDRYQFQWWALGLIDARPAQDKKKGKDTGIDGYIRFLEREGEPAKTVIAQVKSGKVSSRDIRDLVGVLDREKAAIGVFLTLQPPTRDMMKEAVSAGFYKSQWGNFARLQILTIEDLLTGATTVQYPRLNAATFKRAARQRREQGEQSGLF